MINAEQYADRILNTSGSLVEAASWFLGTEAAAITPIEAAQITMSMASRMRGGRIGEDLAVPELLYAAVREVAMNGPRSTWPEG